MSYCVLYVDTGTIVARYDGFVAADQAANELAARRPDLAPEIGVLEFDASGEPSGVFTPARSPLVEASSTAAEAAAAITPENPGLLVDTLRHELVLN